MWIVNWKRLLLFVVVTAAIAGAYKGLYAVTHAGNPWPAFVLIVGGILGALLIDRLEKNKE